MWRSLLRAVVVTTALSTVTFAPPAAAHERRTRAPVQFVVGWGDEPAYAGFKNGVQVRLSRGDQPVTDLGDTLKVEVWFGSQRKTLTLEPNFRVGAFGTPGDYRAWLVPTRPGTYTFRFFGKVGDQDVNETFTSGPQTFDDVNDPSGIQFPASDPSNAELAGRLERETDRQTSATSTARAFGLGGLAVGALGAVLGAAALARKR